MKVRLFIVLLLSPIWSFQLFGQETESDLTWDAIQTTKKGSITAYWHESRPFIYKNKRGSMEGIEANLMNGFVKFLKDHKGIELNVVWKEAESFHATYATIAHQKKATFGVSAFSITEKRQKEVDFARPYMADINVLITSENVPVMKNMDEFQEQLPNLKAITIKETTYEEELRRIQKQGNLSFPIEYIPSSQNILRTIANQENSFGFIDLPVYMMIFKENPSVAVRRQNMFPIKRMGYSFIMPEGSDWKQPLDEYINHPDFKTALHQIIGEHIDLDLYYFVEGLAVESDDEVVMLLTKEKEIQYKNLMGKTEQVLMATRKSNFFFIFASVTLVFLIITIVQYRKRNEQKEEIEAQRKSIAAKSEALEKKNEHLIALDTEKNHLINILAHDLRTPINQIHGLAQLISLDNKTLSQEQKELVRQIMGTSVRLNKMISQLLDIEALEHNNIRLNPEKVDIVQLVQQVIGAFESTAEAKSITLKFTSDWNTSLHIFADPLYVTQILENLISNAIKFSDRGKSTEVGLMERTSHVCIFVKDQGPGMSEDDLQHVFKKFQKLSARPTQGETSFGLGLSIVKKYVDLMNGSVWCESTKGNGATFFVDFPKAVE